MRAAEGLDERFDSFGDSPAYVSFVQGTDINGNLINNATLVAFCLAATGIIAGIVYGMICRLIDGHAAAGPLFLLLFKVDGFHDIIERLA